MVKIIKDYETHYEEKTATMLKLLSNAKLNQELTDTIEDNIYMDKYATIDSLKEHLNKLKKQMRNY